MIKFAYTIFYVKDVVKTISFYEKAFGFNRKFISEGKEYGELDTGSTTLSFATVKLAKSNLPKGFIESKVSGKPFAMEIGLTTDDVDKTLRAAIKAGAKLVEKPKAKPCPPGADSLSTGPATARRRFLYAPSKPTCLPCQFAKANSNCPGDSFAARGNRRRRSAS